MNNIRIRHRSGCDGGEVEGADGPVAPPSFVYLHCGNRGVTGTGRRLGICIKPALGAILISAVHDDNRSDRKILFGQKL